MDNIPSIGDNLGTVTRSIPKKSQTMKEICHLLGITETVTTIGSSVPRVFFTDIATQLGCQNMGTMPLTARAIIEMNGLDWRNDFSSEQTRSGGGGTVTALGLLQVKNAVLVWLGNNPVPLPTDIKLDEWEPDKNWEILRETMQTEIKDVVFRPNANIFRELVLLEYDNFCSISGIRVNAAIEVAHIVPYYGEPSDEIQNAIPMRVDLHRLFDRGLIRVVFDESDKSYIIQIHPTIIDDYGDFNKKKLRIPNDPLSFPSKLALKIKNNIHESIWKTPDLS